MPRGNQDYVVFVKKDENPNGGRPAKECPGEPATWIKNRIKNYEFIEGIDFIAGNFLPGSERIDYHLTIDMAKELSMVERNEKGKQARQYFIEWLLKFSPNGSPRFGSN